jgi:murein DD-endopeptidase MepM/ murein hydrolase activator NlpD
LGPGPGEPTTIAHAATGLVPTDDPVPFPADAGGKFVHQLTVSVRKQACGPAQLQSGPPDCSAPETISQTQLWITLKPTGAYCTAFYDHDVFAIEDGDFATSRPATVTATNLGTSLAATPVTFEADGYAYPAGKAGGVVTLHKGDAFAIYRDDFYQDPPSDFQLFDQFDTVGVQHPAGLMWPRVTGVRNGSPFRYSCLTPDLVKDAVYASGLLFEPPTFLRMPWAAGAAYPVTQGNNGTFTHNGASAYAFDFGMDAGATIRAARGGTVLAIDESRTLNCNKNKGCNRDVACAATVPDALDPCTANYVEIKHQDGLITRYVHMPQNGVFVQVGDQINRGDALGLVGTTGFSTGPHLHFQVQGPDGVTVPSCFEHAVGAKIQSCDVPQTGDSFVSTNKP